MRMSEVEEGYESGRGDVQVRSRVESRSRLRRRVLPWTVTLTLIKEGVTREMCMGSSEKWANG
jgi:hypothetical protein